MTTTNPCREALGVEVAHELWAFVRETLDAWRRRAETPRWRY